MTNLEPKPKTVDRVYSKWTDAVDIEAEAMSPAMSPAMACIIYFSTTSIVGVAGAMIYLEFLSWLLGGP